MTDSKDMLKLAIAAIEEKKGENIKAIDISRISVIADYFVIATAQNASQIEAIADEIEMRFSKEGIEPKQIEGKHTSGWVLMDYKDVIIHIFNKEQRLYYDIERIWTDGRAVEAEELDG